MSNIYTIPMVKKRPLIPFYRVAIKQFGSKVSATNGVVWSKEMPIVSAEPTPLTSSVRKLLRQEGI